MTPIEIKFDELFARLRPHILPDHLPRNYLGEPLAPDWYRPYFSGQPDEGLFVRGNELYYTERGQERLLIRGTDDELLYVIFEGMTSEMAGSFEVRNRNPHTEDTRRDWFPIQQQLMGYINKDWESRLKEKHSKLLGDA